MPRRARELTAREVEELEHPGGRNPVNIAVGGVSGLNLQITPTGARSWILRATVGSRRRQIGLGPYPEIGLAEARDRAREARDAIWRGIDPVEQRKAAKAALVAAQGRDITFEEILDRYGTENEQEFRSDRYRTQWRTSIDRHATPRLGKLLVSKIAVRDILHVLQPIWTNRTEAARRLRQQLEKVLDYAKEAGYRTGENPARWKGNLDAVLPSPDEIASAQNWPALRLEDAVEWYADVRSRPGIAARALQFMALTAASSAEVRGATWAELDLEGGLWSVPAVRLPGGKTQNLPLSPDAIELLRSMPRSDEYVFPSPQNGMLSEMVISQAMRRINEARDGGYPDPVSGRPAVANGLRSTFLAWAAEHRGAARDIGGSARSDLVGRQVEGASARTKSLEEHRETMQAWSDFLQGTASVERLLADYL